ncbi:MAG TPA: hypothetical protein VFD30_14870 [Terriglobia bacterium]|jgi:hypothetical protein|nr:hypothetical protein [Terriglobia bacterium]
MSDRGVFVAAFITVVLIIAGAFVLPQFFYFELAKASIFVAIGILVFFGEDRYSYMLGILAPIFWFLVEFVVGALPRDFVVLFNYLRMKTAPALDTPLHGFALVAAVLLAVLSYRAWKKEVSERFVGKTFWTCLAVSLAYAIVVGLWYRAAF